MIKAIVAYDKNNAIGKNNQLPWKLKDDLKHFKKVTKDSIVVMGRKTYESIGKPLPGRINVVLSRSDNFNPEGVEVCISKQEVLDFINAYYHKDVFIIGGQQIYELFEDEIQMIYTTEVGCEIENADAHFNLSFDDYQFLTDKVYKKNDDNEYNFVIYEVAKQNYIDYLNYCEEVIDSLDDWFYDHFFVYDYRSVSVSADFEKLMLKLLWSQGASLSKASVIFQQAFLKKIRDSFIYEEKNMQFQCDLRPFPNIIFDFFTELGDKNDTLYQLDGDIWFEDGIWKGKYKIAE